jgi:hypothetical protein
MGPSRGLAGRAGLVTRGYGGRFVEQIVEVVRRVIPRGISGVKPEPWDEFTICAKLIEVNGRATRKKIEGCVTVRVPKVKAGAVTSLVEHVRTRARNVWDNIVVTVKRVK